MIEVINVLPISDNLYITEKHKGIANNSTTQKTILPTCFGFMGKGERESERDIIPL